MVTVCCEAICIWLLLTSCNPTIAPLVAMMVSPVLTLSPIFKALCTPVLLTIIAEPIREVTVPMIAMVIAF